MLNESFLGRGWHFPVSVDERGGIRTASAEEDIAQSIRIILGTAPGERIMRPEFGCDLQQLVFAPHGPTTTGLVNYYVREALERWEPRIEVENVTVTSQHDRQEVLLIHLDYRIRRTNDERNLVYPFYRIPAEE